MLADAPVFTAPGAENLSGAVLWPYRTEVILLQLTLPKPLGTMAPSTPKYFVLIFTTVVIYHNNSPRFVCLGQLSTSGPWGAGAQGHKSIAKQAIQEVQRDKGRRWNAMTNSSD